MPSYIRFKKAPTEACEGISLARSDYTESSGPSNTINIPRNPEPIVPLSSSGVRPRRGGIYPLREATATPRRRYYRSSVYSQLEQQQRQNPVSAISLATASSLYSRPTDGAPDAGSPPPSDENDAESFEEEQAIKTAQQALFGDWSFPAATRRAQRREKKLRGKRFFAWLRNRMVWFVWKFLCLPDRPQCEKQAKDEDEAEDGNGPPWDTAVVEHPSVAYAVFMTEVVQALEAQTDREVSPSCDAPCV